MGIMLWGQHLVLAGIKVIWRGRDRKIFSVIELHFYCSFILPIWMVQRKRSFQMSNGGSLQAQSLCLSSITVRPMMLVSKKPIGAQLNMMISDGMLRKSLYIQKLY